MLTIREHDLHSLAVLYDLAPDNLAQMLINWGVLTADPPPPPPQPTAPAGYPCHPTATEVALERNRTQEQREGRADRPRRR